MIMMTIYLIIPLTLTINIPNTSHLHVTTLLNITLHQVHLLGCINLLQVHLLKIVLLLHVVLLLLMIWLDRIILLIHSWMICVRIVESHIIIGILIIDWITFDRLYIIPCNGMQIDVVVEVLIRWCVFVDLQSGSHVGQVLVECLSVHLQLTLIILPNPCYLFRFESAININVIPMQYNFFHLVEDIRMNGSYPILPQNFNLFNLIMTFLYEKKHKQITVDIANDILQGRQKVLIFDKLINNLDIFYYGPFRLELMNGLPDVIQNGWLDAMSRLAHQVFYELSSLEMVDVHQFILDVQQELLHVVLVL